MNVNVYITLKSGVLDTQGKAITHALHGLGFTQLAGVRQGKLLELEIEADSKDQASKLASEMCEKLLANTVIEDYRVEIA